MDKKKLFFSAISKYIGGLLFVGLLLFPPAGTFRYPNAWLFIALMFIPILLMGTALFFKAPELLKKRLNAREKESEQRSVVYVSALSFIASFILAGLDFRFQWLPLPRWLVIAASALLLAAYGLYAEVVRENAYLSRTVEVQEGQKVVDTGLYGIVRHPMYTATILMYLAIPLVLGSAIALVPFLSYIPLIVKRIRNEEKVLEDGLAGYKEYKERVRWRLVPFLW